MFVRLAMLCLLSVPLTGCLGAHVAVSLAQGMAQGIAAAREETRIAQYQRILAEPRKVSVTISTEPEHATCRAPETEATPSLESKSRTVTIDRMKISNRVICKADGFFERSNTFVGKAERYTVRVKGDGFWLLYKDEPHYFYFYPDAAKEIVKLTPTSFPTADKKSKYFAEARAALDSKIKAIEATYMEDHWCGLDSTRDVCDELPVVLKALKSERLEELQQQEKIAKVDVGT